MKMLADFFLADSMRALAMVLGGVAFALAVSEAWLYRSRYRDSRDPWAGRKRLRFMGLIRVGIALIVLLVVLVVGTHLGEETLTFRTPAAIVGFTFLIAGMGAILREDEQVKDERMSHGRRDTDNVG